jgi:hypothetical protein
MLDKPTYFKDKYISKRATIPIKKASNEHLNKFQAAPEKTDVINRLINMNH